MLLVAGPEEDMAVAAQKAKEIKKKGVKPLGTEDRAVTQLVEAVKQKSIDGAVEEKHEQQQADLAVGRRHKSRRAG